MSTKKMINLDALVNEGTEVQLGGKIYTLHDASVVQLLNFVNKSEEVSEIKLVGLVIELLYELCPEAKEEKAFDSLSMKQVQTIFDNFVMGNVENPIAKVSETKPELSDGTSKKK